MMRRTTLLRNFTVIIIMFGLLTGCASAPPAKNRFFWPPLPDEPKIEWLGAYRSQNDLPKTGFKKFMEKIVGADEPINFERPMGVVSDGAGKAYIADPLKASVMVYDFNLNTVHVFGKNIAEDLFKEPMGLAMDSAGNIYVSDAAAKRIYVFSPDEKMLNSFTLTAETMRPIGIAVDNERKRLIVADPRGYKVDVYELSGKHLFKIGKPGGGDGEFNLPSWVSLLKNGTIVVSDGMNARLQLFDPEGKFIRAIGKRGDNPEDFQMPKGVAVDSEGHIYSVDGKSNNFKIYSEIGEYLLTVGGAYTSEFKIAPGGFLLPQGIAIDRNNTIYIVDQFNSRFQKFQYMDERYLKEHPIETAPQAVK
jgi:sugar lactone lactonase YvrE